MNQIANIAADVDVAGPSPRRVSVPVMVGNAVHCKAVTDALLRRHHIYVQPINYPGWRRQGRG